MLCWQETLTSTLEQYGDPSGHSAMALTVGVPCGIAAQLVLDGVLNMPGCTCRTPKRFATRYARGWRRRGWGWWRGCCSCCYNDTAVFLERFFLNKRRQVAAVRTCWISAPSSVDLGLFSEEFYMVR